MRCSKAREWLSLALDGQIAPDRTFSLEEHLERCAECHSYREDLLQGQRMLRATEPKLPENFDWHLQLQMNRMLQEAAQVALTPWQEQASARRSWWRNFGLAGAGGLAAALAMALLVLPQQPGPGLDVAATGPLPVQPALESPFAKQIGADRLPIAQTDAAWFGGGPVQRVSLSGTRTRPGPLGEGVRSGWSGTSLSDLKTIARLRDENRYLRTALLTTQREMKVIKAQLDTARSGPADLRLNVR